MPSEHPRKEVADAVATLARLLCSRREHYAFALEDRVCLVCVEEARSWVAWLRSEGWQLALLAETQPKVLAEGETVGAGESSSFIAFIRDLPVPPGTCVAVVLAEGTAERG